MDEIVRAMILHELPAQPSLPEELEAELAAFEHLSDDVLWLLANSTLAEVQQQELAQINETTQRRDLALAEKERQQILLDAYHRILIRRAHAAAILKGRGYEVLGHINSQAE